jgi:hypothetical protein
MSSLDLRRGVPSDQQALFRVLIEALTDLSPLSRWWESGKSTLTLKLLVGRGWSNFLEGFRNCQTSCSNPFCGKFDSQEVRHLLILRQGAIAEGAKRDLPRIGTLPWSWYSVAVSAFQKTPQGRWRDAALRQTDKMNNRIDEDYTQSDLAPLNPGHTSSRHNLSTRCHRETARHVSGGCIGVYYDNKCN